MLQSAVTHTHETKSKKINPQAKEVRRMLQQNLNKKKIKKKINFFFLVVISTPVGYFDPGGDGAHPSDPTKNKKQNLNPNLFIYLFIFFKKFLR